MKILKPLPVIVWVVSLCLVSTSAQGVTNQTIQECTQSLYNQGVDLNTAASTCADNLKFTSSKDTLPTCAISLYNLGLKVEDAAYYCTERLYLHPAVQPVGSCIIGLQNIGITQKSAVKFCSKLTPS